MTPLRALIFTAVSSKIQTETDKMSLPEQERLCRAFADANSMVVIETLSIHGHSRSETDIFTLFEDYAAIGVTAYHKLRQHWITGNFDVLVCVAPHRLGRSSSIVTFILENVIKRERRAYFIQGASRLRNGGSVVTSSTSSIKRHKSLNSPFTRVHSRLFGPYGRPSRTLTDVHPHSQSHSPSIPKNLGILPNHLPQHPHVTTTESAFISLYGTAELSDLFILFSFSAIALPPRNRILMCILHPIRLSVHTMIRFCPYMSKSEFYTMIRIACLPFSSLVWGMNRQKGSSGQTHHLLLHQLRRRKRTHPL